MPHKSSGSGIYCIRNLLNDKVYIGQAVHLERRLYEHRHYLELGKDKAIALQRSVTKYGLENFEFYVLEYCKSNELNDLEIFYIQEFNSTNRKCGYNISSGGNSGLIGYKWPEEFGRKISRTKKAQKLKMPENVKKMLRNINIGKTVSDETRKKMSIANTKENHPMWGRKHSAETIQHYKEVRGAEKAYQFGTKSDNSTSRFFGVNRILSKGKYVYWVAYVKVKGVKHYIGSSKIEEDAARMYDEFIIKNGLPNPLNFS